MISLDYETYSEAGYQWCPVQNKVVGTEPGTPKKTGLDLVGAYNYLSHPSAEIICAAAGSTVADVERWVPGMPRPRRLIDHVWRGGLVGAFNTFFEYNAWNLICTRLYDWPPLRLEQMRCSMALAAINGYPRSLAALGEPLRLSQRKDKIGGKLITELTKPQRVEVRAIGRKLNKLVGAPFTPARKADLKVFEYRVRPTHAPAAFEAFYRYCEQDVRTEIEAAGKMPPMCPRELRIWQMDQRINQRGVPIDLREVNNCIRIADRVVERGNAEIRELTGHSVEGFSKAADMMRWLATRGCHTEKLDEEHVAELLARTYPADVLRVLKLRSELNFGSIKKLYAMRAQTCHDGRLRDQYAYAAAHTHLWNGQSVQISNLYKGTINTADEIEDALDVIATGCIETVERKYGDAMQLLANCLRSMIAVDGERWLIQADFSAIQAVVTSALAGEKWRLDVFHGDGRIYETTAAQLTGKTVEYYAQYRKENGKHHPDRQTYGKIPVLATDFGAWINGWKRFGAEVFGDDKAIKDIILRSWKSTPAITELRGGQTRNKFNRAPDGGYAPERPELYGLEGAAIAAVLNPGQCFGYRGVRYLYVQACDALYCAPPGDYAPLQYHAPRQEPSRRQWARPWELDLSYECYSEGQWTRTGLYAGICTQNVVAKIAREFQADALLALDEHPSGRYPVVAHTHDEQVVETVNGTTEEYLSIVRASVPKPWAVDDWGRPWPIKLPGAERVKRYGKWD